LLFSEFFCEISRQANLRVLEVHEIKTVPDAPLSHPFVERLIGTIRREYLDQTLFWTAADLEEKLEAFRCYFNRHRTHSGLKGRPPESDEKQAPLNIAAYRWRQHCRGLFQTPQGAWSQEFATHTSRKFLTLLGPSFVRKQSCGS